MGFKSTSGSRREVDDLVRQLRARMRSGPSTRTTAIIERLGDLGARAASAVDALMECTEYVPWQRDALVAIASIGPAAVKAFDLLYETLTDAGTGQDIAGALQAIGGLGPVHARAKEYARIWVPDYRDAGMEWEIRLWAEYAAWRHGMASTAELLSLLAEAAAVPPDGTTESFIAEVALRVGEAARPLLEQMNRHSDMQWMAGRALTCMDRGYRRLALLCDL